MSDSGLFSPLALRGVSFRNRIGVSPMCQYSCVDGYANDWHLVHLGSRAVGGAGMVMVEAAAVTADGRISPQDVGVWTDDQMEPLARCADFIAAEGAVPAIQLAHAGRKASTAPPWEGGGTVSEADGGWRPVWAPSAQAFGAQSLVPEALQVHQIQALVGDFLAAAKRALAAGFKLIELHAAHGYLFHEFLSPLSNQRSDAYGGSFDNRTRFLREVVEAVRAVWPDHLPLFVRVSATDWVEGGWDLEQSVELARQLQPLGVDLLDCSSGGLTPHAKIPLGPGYQVPGAELVRGRTGMPTAAVGLITDPEQADQIIRQGQADMVLLARQLLRDPYWPLHAAKTLGATAEWPLQYQRARP